MTRRTAFWPSFSVALLLPLACANEPKETPKPAAEATPKTASTSTSSAVAPASPPPDAAARIANVHPPRGTAMKLLSAARELELKDEQKTRIGEIEKQLGAEEEPGESKQAIKELHEATVAGAKTGKIDPAKLEPHYAAIDKAAASRRERDEKALGELHALLTPEQRKAVAESLSKRLAEKKDMAPAKEGSKPPDADREAERAKRRLEQLAREVDLDEEQKKKIEPLLVKYLKDLGDRRKRDEGQKSMTALLTAFEKEKFDPKKVDLGKPSKAIREMMQSKVSYANAVLGVLKPEQREKFASTLEEPQGMRRGGPGGRPGWPMSRRHGGPAGPGAPSPRPEDEPESPEP